MELGNNCTECNHHKTQRAIEASNPNEEKLHCYMFRTEPQGTCMQNSNIHPIREFRGLFSAIFDD